jgi:hypothetical protein|tara:strand:- start:921 stop:1094 length:174 start_codon:yes stop_codon:yes gene_type:complete
MIKIPVIGIPNFAGFIYVKLVNLLVRKARESTKRARDYLITPGVVESNRIDYISMSF